MSNTCKLCLFKSEVEDEESFHPEDIEKTLNMIKELFNDKVQITIDEVLMVCKPCQEKLESFYSYYLLVIENQTAYNEKLEAGLMKVVGDEVEVFVEPITKIEEKEENTGSCRKSKRIRGEQPASDLKEEDESDGKSETGMDWNDDDDFSDLSDEYLPKKPQEKEEPREKDPERVKCGKMGPPAARRKKRLREIPVSETRALRNKLKIPREPKPKKEIQEPKTRSEKEEREGLIRKYFSNKCDDCGGQDFTTFSELSKHCKQEHGSRKHYICCGVFLSTGRAIHQHCLEHENPIQCNYCGTVCVSNAQHKRHLLEAHGVVKRPEEEKPYECHLCHRRYSDRSEIRRHMKRTHLTKSETAFVCETCARPYKTAASLKIHIRRDHLGEKLPKSQCPHCSKWILNTGMPHHVRKHMAPPPTEKFKCDKCGSQHTQYHGLLKHQKRHHSELSNRFQCPQCPKGFFSKTSFDEHFAVHTGETLYDCEFCSAGFKSMGNFLAHKRKLHPVLYAQQKLANKLKREEKSRPQ